MKRFSYKQKISTITILFVLFLSQFALLTPRPAYAQWSVLNPDIIAQNIQTKLSTSINENIEKAWVASVASMLVNVMLATVNYASYQAAITVATGGPADAPLFTNLTADEYMQYVGANTIFEAYKSIESADDVLTLFGVRVPDDAEFLAIVREGLKDSATREVGEFDYREVLGNWDSYLVSVYDTNDPPEVRTEKILRTLSASFDQNEYRSGLSIYSQTIFKAEEQARLAREDQLLNAGFLDKVDPVTGRVLVPAEMIRKQFEDALAAVQNLPTEIGLSTLGGDQNVLLQLGVYAGSIFTQTLGSELMQKILSQGLVSGFDFDPFNPNARSGLTRQRAAEQYKSLLSFRPIQISDYNLLSRLSSCPAQYLRNSPQLYSCAIDTSFAAAVARADAGISMTIVDAIDEGYIDRNWPLIPSSDIARNQDPTCYTYGFCYSNLVKLRKARIIPIGWELAADAPENSASGPVTLGEVMDAFNDCDENGERSSQFPWCHLIDPNWVLKYPQAQCRTLGFGQLLTAGGATDRAEECVDVQSCISENDDGTCDGGYGYCVREKNVWQFRGDACPSQYASCLSFENSSGEPVDYLTSTVDYGACDENSVGCLWFATQKLAQASGNFAWPDIGNLDFTDNSPNAYKNRLYLNSNREACDASEGGCQELLVRGEGLSLNLLQNSSFELDADNNAWPDAWLSGTYPSANISRDQSESRSGSSAITTQGTSFYQFGAMLDQRQLYTYSFYAKQRTTSGGSAVTSYVVLRDENSLQGADLTGVSIIGNCQAVGYDTLPGLDAVRLIASPTSEEYERFSCTFTTPSLTNRTAQLSAEVVFENSILWIDDVQLEQNEEASIYHTDYNQAYSAIQKTVVQMPPDYLECTGSSTDAEECANYAQICTENDRGCNAYSPVNGDPTVIGIVGDLDVCPSICVGYDTYKQEPTLYEPEGAFPLYFIADSADSCTEAAVGCDEFTNLSTEEQEYFTYLRGCVTEDQARINTGGDNAAVYYTWEGSDTEGFQLKTWQLLESDLGNAPCTNWQANANGIACDDANGDYAVSAPASCNDHADIFVNPDCREFYDAEGYIFYRPWSETVSVNNSCTTYRKTNLVGASEGDREDNCQGSGGYFDTVSSECRYFGYSQESETCREADNGCRKYTGGTSRNSRVAFDEVFENNTLNQWASTSAANVSLSNDSVATGGHSMSSNGQKIWTYTYDNNVPCASTSGCSSGTGNLGGSCVVLEGQIYCGTLSNELFQDKTYTLTFWAKGSGSVNVGFDIEANPGNISLDAPFSDSGLQLTSEWKRYSVGPLNMRAMQYPTFGKGSVLAFVPANSGVTFNIDNVVLREGESDITIIKDSWITPAQCDTNLQGQASPQFHLGCQEYADRGGRTAYLKSVSRLCGESQVGCSAYFKTAQSTPANAQILNATCNNVDADNNGTPDSVTTKTACYLETLVLGTAFNTNSPKLCDISVGESSCLFDLDYFLPETTFTDAVFAHLNYGPETAYVEADRAVYAIVDDADLCAANSAGCQELGAFNLSADQTVVDSWDSVWLVNDPDTYDQVLCSGEQLYCDAFNAGSEGVWYFKDPAARTCEYRNDVYVGGQSYDGWFRTGSDEFCYGTGSCSNTGASCSTDSECRVGACAASGDTCYADFDCPGTDICLNDSIATCNITSGSYVVGGSVSGIWRTGDPAYNGWTGLCGPEYNGCSEFRDILDFAKDEFYGQTSGQSYYFVDNQNLDENTLLSSQKCNGLVSQELGCVLFHDTGEAGLDFNASSSYIASQHADEIFGDNKLSLVKPITCDRGANISSITKIDGSTVDLCANRCAYPKSSLLSSAEYSGLTFATTADEYIFGGSCYTNSDCASYDSAIGDLVVGECASVVFSEVGLEPYPAPRLRNDTNRVLKVNRDRECSEWLTCSSSQTVWDEDSASYRTICNEIDLCTEYSNTGDSSFCSKWNPDDPAIVIDSERYSSRDITWYGEEFSGYAIPGIYPVQHLTQVNVAPPGTCEGFAASSGRDIDIALGDRTGDYCETDAECETGKTCVVNLEKDYRLAFEAGSCSNAATFGSTCTVGYCADSGAACSANTNCLGSTCVTGACVDAAGTPNGSLCDINFACTTGTCNVSVATKQGSCFYGKCALSPEGKRLNDETAESSTCRAYPEIDAPFANEVVEKWINADNLLDSSTNPEAMTRFNVRSLPYSTRAGFENANLCAPGEDCLCTYKKISTSVGVKTYLDAETDLTDLTHDSALGGIAGGRLGICSGGDADGAMCVKDEDCNGSDGTETVDVALGKCYPIVREDTIVGLDGFCLERDSGININGDSNTGACLTWFPVDQLEGATDLFAKYKEAGYFGNTEYCAKVVPYVNIPASEAVVPDANVTDWKGAAGIACSEQVSNNCITGNEEFHCPPNHYAVMSEWYHPGDNDQQTFARACAQSGTDNDCPFVCVPNDAVDSTGASCLETVVKPFNAKYSKYETNDWIEQGVDGTAIDPWKTTVYYFKDNYHVFDNVAENLQDCTAYGVEVNMNLSADAVWSTRNQDVNKHNGKTYTAGMVESYQLSNVSGKGWYNYSQSISGDYYLGCQQSIVTDDDSGSAAPYTDKLLNPTANYTIPHNPISVSEIGYTPDFDYTNQTKAEPFGTTIPANEIDSAVDPNPAVVASCKFIDNDGYQSLAAPGRNDVCNVGDYFGDIDNPEARSFVDFFYKSILMQDGGIAYIWDLTSVFGPPGPLATVSESMPGIQKIFAKGFHGWQFNDGANSDGMGSMDIEITGANLWDWDFRSNGNPPTVWAIDPQKCYGAYCQEGEENELTLNSQNGGDLEGDGGFFRATMQFFAAADKNQLPIRRIIVDWGDGKQDGSASADNYYKNHRGLEDGSQTTSICARCDDGGSDCEWGMTADSCDPNYLTYQHNYRCSRSDIYEMQTNGQICNFANDLTGPCTDGTACYYQPKVHVRDNWGWCTGVCTYSGDDGCFDAIGTLEMPDDAGECNYNNYPRLNQNRNPWVYYSGVIRVEP